MTAQPRTGRLALAGLAAAATLAAGVTSAGAERGQTAASQPAAIACLKRAGGVVGPVKPLNRRLRALRDLAQRTSQQVQIGRTIVGLAFQSGGSAAELLVELLRAPNDLYTVVQHGSIVVLAPKRAPGVRARVVACVS